MKTETTPFDAAQYMTDKAAQKELMAEAVASGDPDAVAAARNIVARADAASSTPRWRSTTPGRNLDSRT